MRVPKGAYFMPLGEPVTLIQKLGTNRSTSFINLLASLCRGSPQLIELGICRDRSRSNGLRKYCLNRKFNVEMYYYCNAYMIRKNAPPLNCLIFVLTVKALIRALIMRILVRRNKSNTGLGIKQLVCKLTPRILLLEALTTMIIRYTLPISPSRNSKRNLFPAVTFVHIWVSTEPHKGVYPSNTPVMNSSRWDMRCFPQKVAIWTSDFYEQSVSRSHVYFRYSIPKDSTLQPLSFYLWISRVKHLSTLGISKVEKRNISTPCPLLICQMFLSKLIISERRRYFL